MFKYTHRFPKNSEKNEKYIYYNSRNRRNNYHHWRSFCLYILINSHIYTYPNILPQHLRQPKRLPLHPQQLATPNPTPTSSPAQTQTPVFTPTPTHAPTTLTVATTTSLHDTGLEDNGTANIKDIFQAAYPWITVNFVALGTGAAISTAEAGDADMILVHSPSQELPFLTGGYGVDRKIIAYNFFVIVGPTNDPAGISGMTNVTQALIKLYTAAQTNSQVQWFTRNDGSGTATAESNLWKAAGYSYTTLVQNTTWFTQPVQEWGRLYRKLARNWRRCSRLLFVRYRNIPCLF